MECSNLTENAVDFFPTEDARKALFLLGLQNLEDVPFPLDDVLVKKSDAAVTDSHGVGGPLALVPAVEEIIPEFLFADLIRLFVEMLDQHPNGPGVAFLSAFAFTVDLKGLNPTSWSDFFIVIITGVYTKQKRDFGTTYF